MSYSISSERHTIARCNVFYRFVPCTKLFFFSHGTANLERKPLTSRTDSLFGMQYCLTANTYVKEAKEVSSDFMSILWLDDIPWLNHSSRLGDALLVFREGKDSNLSQSSRSSFSSVFLACLQDRPV